MKYVITREFVLNGKRIFEVIDIAGTVEQGIEKLSEAMSCKWGHNETFALLKVEIGGITTIFPNDIPEYKRNRK